MNPQLDQKISLESKLIKLFDEKFNFDLKEYREISKNLTNYVALNNINNVIFLDRSARIGYIGFKKEWKKKFPNNKCPNIYFINPTPFGKKSIEELDTEFNSSYTQLSNDILTQNTLIYDTCMHTGKSISPLKQYLESKISKKVRTGLMQKENEKSRGHPSHFNCDLNIDFYANFKPSLSKCNPVGRDFLTIKGELIRPEINEKNIYLRIIKYLFSDDLEIKNNGGKLRKKLYEFY